VHAKLSRLITTGSNHSALTTANNNRLIFQLRIQQAGYGNKKTIEVHVNDGSVLNKIKVNHDNCILE
jgi:hypothetical protein